MLSEETDNQSSSNKSIKSRDLKDELLSSTKQTTGHSTPALTQTDLPSSPPDPKSTTTPQTASPTPGGKLTSEQIALAAVEAAKKKKLVSTSSKTGAIVLVTLVNLGNCYILNLPQVLSEQMFILFHIDQTQLNLNYSFYYLPNIVIMLLVPFFINKVRTSKLAILTSFLVFIGSIICSYAVEYRNFDMLIWGRIIYGLGGELSILSINIVVDKWFTGAFVTSLIILVDQLGIAFSNYFSVPLMIKERSPTFPFIVASFLCFVGVLCSIFLVYYEDILDDKRLRESLLTVSQASRIDDALNITEDEEVMSEARNTLKQLESQGGAFSRGVESRDFWPEMRRGGPGARHYGNELIFNDMIPSGEFLDEVVKHKEVNTTKLKTLFGCFLCFL